MVLEIYSRDTKCVLWVNRVWIEVFLTEGIFQSQLSNVNLKIQHTILNKQSRAANLYFRRMRPRNLLPQIFHIALTTERRNLKTRLETANPEERVKQSGEKICQSQSQTRHLVFPLPLVPFRNYLNLEAYAIPEFTNWETDLFLVLSAFWEAIRSQLNQQCQAKQLPGCSLWFVPTASSRLEAASRNWRIIAPSLDYSILWLPARCFSC